MVISHPILRINLPRTAMQVASNHRINSDCHRRYDVIYFQKLNPTKSNQRTEGLHSLPNLIGPSPTSLLPAFLSNREKDRHLFGVGWRIPPSTPTPRSYIVRTLAYVDHYQDHAYRIQYCTGEETGQSHNGALSSVSAALYCPFDSVPERQLIVPHDTDDLEANLDTDADNDVEATASTDTIITASTNVETPIEDRALPAADSSLSITDSALSESPLSTSFDTIESSTSRMRRIADDVYCCFTRFR